MKSGIVKTSWWIMAAALLALSAPALFSQIPTQEQNNGDDSLMQLTDDWEVIQKVNLWYNTESRNALREIISKKKAMRETALEMAQPRTGMDEHADLLDDPKGTALDFNNSGNQVIDEMAKEIRLATLVNLGGRMKLVTFQDPKYMPAVGASRRGSYRSIRTDQLARKVSTRLQNAVQHSKSLRRLDRAVRKMAETLFPRKLMKKFDPQKIARHLLAKSGIIEIADGIILRPPSPQDQVYAEFANLGSSGMDKMLFWSDPLVLSGYDPVWGKALNSTELKGYRAVDMDNMVSRGYSQAIDKWNRLEPPERRIENPFRGYAARVIPGLITMGEQGRLTPGENPDNVQLAEAMKLSRKLKMLPSDFLGSLARKTSAADDRVMGDTEQFRFVYPAKVIRVQSRTGGSTRLVKLARADLDIFLNIMRMNYERLEDIAKLKDENLRGRQYVQELIDSNKRIEQEMARIADKMDLYHSIPQITQLRKDLFSSMEELRWQLSELHHQYDDLKHREWEILENTMATATEYAREKLMANGPIRDASAVHGYEAQQGGGGI